MSNLGPVIKMLETINDAKKTMIEAMAPTSDIEPTLEMGDGHGTQNFASEAAPETPVKKETPYFGDALQSTVIREADKAKTYDKLVNDGHHEDLIKKQDQLLTILNEVQATTHYGGNPMITKDKLEEYVFLALEEEKQEKNSHQSQNGEEEHDEDNEPTEVVTIKNSNPGYFKSLVSKI
ncbi:hypothetical protein K1X76_07365 [bacterium]|nr:hypothetical protein [bacterium]